MYLRKINKVSSVASAVDRCYPSIKIFIGLRKARCCRKINRFPVRLGIETASAYHHTALRIRCIVKENYRRKLKCKLISISTSLIINAQCRLSDLSTRWNEFLVRNFSFQKSNHIFVIIDFLPFIIQLFPIRAEFLARRQPKFQPIRAFLVQIYHQGKRLKVWGGKRSTTFDLFILNIFSAKPKCRSTGTVPMNVNIGVKSHKNR